MPSEFVAAPVDGDRRTRKRAARRDTLLDLAADLVEQHGVDGVTMAALAEAADYAPASLYTYFSSRSALLAALQQRALEVLAGVAEESADQWDRQLDERGAGGAVAALARLWAFSRLFLTAPEHHPRELLLQQQLLVTPGVEDTADAARVVPAAMAALVVPQRLLAAAVEAGALAPPPPTPSPLGEPLPGELGRTLGWVTALNGALLLDRLSTGLPTTGAHVGAELTGSLLVGWGADPAAVAEALDLADHLELPRGGSR